MVTLTLLEVEIWRNLAFFADRVFRLPVAIPHATVHGLQT